ncbi:MAG TPA: ABC transporter permease [Gemmatimonadaceae bacterium]|nr:ABC transporter permease [Gemmatimonadaceae bacterium]
MSGEQRAERPSRTARLIALFYPASLRASLDDEIARFIDECRGEARYRAGFAGRARLLAHLAADVLAARVAVRGPVRTPLGMVGHRERRIETLRQDARLACRAMAKRPAFTAVAALTLTLGIGANTAIFSVVSAVLLRPLPFPNADRLAVLWATNGSNKQLLTSIDDVADWRTRTHTFDDIGVARTQSVNLTGTGTPDRLVGSFVSANTLALLGVHMALGRTFTPAETQRGTGQQVAVISYDAWQSRFGGDSSLVGRTLVLNGRPHVVIGVTAQAFTDPFGGAEVWLPITSAPNASWFERGTPSVWAVGRVHRGATMADAQRDLSAVAAQLAAEYPATNAGAGAVVVPIRDFIVGTVRPTLLIVLAFVGIVLLIACANVANLQLARATGRRREMSLRAALGAGRSRLVRQLLTENLVLSLLGGAAGVVFARVAIGALVDAVPGGVPAFGHVGIDGAVLAFSAALTVGAGILFGLAPAIHATRTRLTDVLGVRSGDAGRPHRVDTRQVFAAVQLALCIVLLAAAGLLNRSLLALRDVNVGFDARHVLTAEFRLPAVKYRSDTAITAFMNRAVASIREIPGVQSAALVNAVPLSGNFGVSTYVAEGSPPVDPAREPSAQTNGVTDQFFRTLRIPLIAGRDFDSRDRADAAPVVIVDEELARRAWPRESAIGKRIVVRFAPVETATVIGVVKNVKQFTVGETASAQIYAPISQQPGIFNSVVARTAGDPMLLAAALRSAIWAVDPEQPVWKVRSLESLVQRDMAGPRFAVVLTAAFALLALSLAVVGVYGVMSFTVAQRTHEVGVRMALGARRKDVTRMVLVQGGRVVVVAIGLGLVGALGAGRLIRSQLFGVSATDPLTLAAVTLGLGVVALAACYLPARRAARVDPMIALRAE